jgi:hypothetical protein
MSIDGRDDRPEGWSLAETQMLEAYFDACYDWLDSHGYFWEIWDRPDDTEWICEAYDAGHPPDYAAVVLTQRWRRFTVV